MKKNVSITTLFLDVGGVLLTNGWDHHARRRAAKHFKLDWREMEARHSLNFVIYETDQLTLQEYLGGFLQKAIIHAGGLLAFHVCSIKTLF
jgi:putative hydrolase of the HAD superfamily